MKRKTIKFISIMMASLLCLSVVGCASKEEKQAQIVEQQKTTAAGLEVNQNDYRGGYMRTQAIKKKVIEVLNNFNASQNKEIIQQNPSNYWNDENFLYFDTNFLVSEWFENTRFFNEFQTDWDTQKDAMMKLFVNENGNFVYPGVRDIKIAKDENTTNLYHVNYSWTGVPGYVKSQATAFHMGYHIDCTYDANHDWLQMIRTASCSQLADVDITEEVLEYGRQKSTNSFVIQFPLERLYITYETLEGTSENEFNPLENAKIKSFAYSKLSGKKLPYYTEAEISKIEGGILTESVKTEGLDENGDVVYHYNLKDSIFPHFSDITADWVLEYPIEEGYYDNYIVFDGKDMIIYNQNKMSNQMEIIEFHSDGTIQDKTLSLVETLTPFTLNWVSEDGSQTGTVDLFVNESHDLTTDNGEILIPAANALYNSEGRVIVTDEFLVKIGVLEDASETPSEEDSQVTEEDSEEDNSEKTEKENKAE